MTVLTSARVATLEAAWNITTARTLLTIGCVALWLGAAPAHAQPVELPDAIVARVSSEVLDAVKADKSIQSGDIKRVTELVDQKVLPYMDFRRMTSSAVGQPWRTATPEQQQQLEAEFKMLLVRTYAGALAQIQPEDKVVVKPTRGASTGDEVVVRTEVHGQADPIQLDFRLYKSSLGWKIFDFNVLGVWLVENYRNSFAQEINSHGIDGLVAKLKERNGASSSTKS